MKNVTGVTKSKFLSVGIVLLGCGRSVTIASIALGEVLGGVELGLRVMHIATSLLAPPLATYSTPNSVIYIICLLSTLLCRWCKMSDTDLSSTLCDDDTAFLLTNSCDERYKLTYADCNISDYQLEKLRFIAYSRLQVASVRDADCGQIYNDLKIKYGHNSAMAALVLNMMLGVAGVEGMQSTASLSGIDDFPDNGFEWRWKLIRYSDKAVKQRRVPEFINYLYRVFSIRYRKAQYVSADSPIQLLVYMIDEQILEVGNEIDLQRVGKFFNLCKLLIL